MFSSKRTLFVFVVVILVVGWYFIFYYKAHPTTLGVKTVTSSNVSIFVEPNEGHTPILEAINEARKEILVEVYLLSDKEVVGALKESCNRGVKVNVILEEHPFGGGGINPKTKKDFESSCVKVEWSNPAFALTHEKAVIVDGTCAYVLTQNLTEASFTKNREYGVKTCEVSDVGEIRNIFMADWNRSSYVPSDPDLVVSPNTSRALITGLIKMAKSEIDIEVEAISDPIVDDLLKEKAKDVEVKIITPTLKQLSGNKNDLSELKNARVNVKTISTPYMHAKLILVDGKVAYTGSVNLTSQSMDENRELGIIMSGESVSILYSTFYEDWGRGISY